MLGNIAGVGCEGLGSIGGLPPAFVLEGLGEIPVEERAVGLDAVGEEFVYETVVEVETFGVGGSGAGGEDARPGDGKTIGLKAEDLHELHIFFVAMVVVVGYVASIPVVGLAGDVREGVPDGGAAAVFMNGAFDLIGCGGGAPKETLREA